MASVRMDQRCCHSMQAVLLLVVGTLLLITPTVSGLVREYYVAAITVDWDYSNGQDSSSDNVFKKIVYKEYEKGFIASKRSSKLSGILGPTLRAEVGDTLKVHFRNMATKPLTIHPQGITYGKLSEGVKYADGTSLLEKFDDSVLPGQTYTYSWDITENMGPKEDDPDCLTNIYYSAENMVQDVNSGLIGALLICKTGSLKEDGTPKNFNKEFVLLFAVFDESKSWQAIPSTKERPVMYTINGYAKGTGPDFKACADDKINWHLLGMSSKPEIFSVHFFGQTLNEDHHRVSVISLASSASTSANMTATQSGKLTISSLNKNHIEAGMQAYLDVETCTSKDHRKQVYQTRFIKSWDHFIAAVEVDWDYAYRSSDPSASTSCHQTFKKVVYRLYTDSTFRTPTEPERSRRELGLIGPVIRAQVKDTIMVVFKNMASQPHNIYPHGVSLQRFFKGYVPDLKGEEIQNNTVMPGETVTYYWTVLDIDEPTKNDPQCLTRIYHSTVNIVKDMASGLLGTLLICKSMSLNTRGLQEKADEEQIAMFAVFDENKSWYYEVNKPKACSWMHTKDPKNLYNYYVINTINGNSLKDAILGFCYNHVVQWHVSSVGIWDETLTLQFSGHTFRYRRGGGDLVTLFPMTSESIITEMNNIGVWLFGNFNLNESPGMNVRFRDVKCFAPVDYDEFLDEEFTFNYPDVRTGPDDNNEEIEILTEEDDYSEMMAEKLGIRSRKNNTGAVEETFNLTALAIDDIYETSITNVGVLSNASTSGSYDIHSSESTEDEYNKNVTLEGGQDIPRESVSVNEYVVPTSPSNSTEGFNHMDTLQSATPDQSEEIFNRTEDVYIHDHNSTDADKEENIIQAENDFSTYFEEPTNGTEKEDIEAMEKTNSSEVIKSINVAKRDVEKASNYMFFDLRYRENNSKQWEETVPDNIVQWPHGTEGFMEKHEINTTPGVPSQTSSDSLPIDDNGGQHHPQTVASPTFQPKSHPEFTITTATDEKTSTSLERLGTTKSSITDYYDSEIKEMLGDQIFEDIMKIIMFEPQSNETVLEEDSGLIAIEEKLDDINESGNQSNPSSNDITKQSSQTKAIKKQTIIYGKKMEKFQFHTIANNSSRIKYVKRAKRVGKVKEKRTANSSYNKLHMSNSTQFEYESSNISSNNENITADNNIMLSPRGFNPRSVFKFVKEIVIGVPRGGDGEYEEYDTDAEFSTDMEEKPKLMMAFEDPYKIQTVDDVNRYTNPDRIIENFLRTSKGMKRIYYIAAEEVQWDYMGRAIRYNVNEKPASESRGPVYKKVIFRQYLDSTFKKPAVDGEYEEHLGILGPVIRAEVEDVIQVTFKNLATRPYSIHAHGVSYEKSSEGYSYADETEDWLQGDDIIKPGKSYVYVWYATKQSGPEPEASACRTWAYHSGVNVEKDIHSGLIGPLLICRNGTLDKENNRPLDAREFILLFMTFEEEKSWYFDKTKNTCTGITEKPAYANKCHTFHAINGIIYNLQGLQMYQDELVRWHLLNMGNTKDIHVINFHGQTVTESITNEHRLAVYPLIPGSFATVEMRPSKPGLWQLDTEVAEYQQAGMQAIFNIADADCNFPLGLANGLISDDQISASHYIDYWEPKFARLNNVGSYNAWSAHMNKSSLPWIQVDLQKTHLISGIKTQGASKYFSQYYITEFFVLYSKDKRKWTAFKGNSSTLHKIFKGNIDSSNIKENQFDPPIAARYIRIYPTKYQNKPALRMELLGCGINGCSTPLGMENSSIKDQQITASSHKWSWYSSPWLPSLARLNKAGSVNAWQAKSNNNQQWLQIDFLTVKKITAITTQGAKQFASEMYVQSYGIHYSDDGRTWKSYIDDSTSMEKIFRGNSNSAGYAKNNFNPPIFSRFLKIIPKSWNQGIVMRVELYGCNI
ncbi:PREDICTED: coagulation factor V [Nanorana parkeri]|uniref:coagulation factor V n=1 Tax=Nanorana parkeri TaxID=125878 RepID=UPI000854A9AD|nr:PREDICTED: coagulation factor V [Nanorana parkeri]